MKTPDTVLTEIAVDAILFDAGKGVKEWKLAWMKELVIMMAGGVWKPSAIGPKGCSEWVDSAMVLRVMDLLFRKRLGRRLTVRWLAQYESFEELEKNLGFYP